MTTPDEVLRASASISETVAEMCDALRIMEIKRPDSIPLQRMYAILSAARAKGWQLVPVEPTEDEHYHVTRLGAEAAGVLGRCRREDVRR